MSSKKRADIQFEEGSGNVFADLELQDADALFIRAQLGFYVFKILESRQLKQRDIAAILGIAQPDVSHLMNGHFSRFTTEKLLEFLKRLGWKVTIQLKPHKPEEPYQEVNFAARALQQRLLNVAVGSRVRSRPPKTKVPDKV